MPAEGASPVMGAAEGVLMRSVGERAVGDAEASWTGGEVPTVGGEGVAASMATVEGTADGRWVPGDVSET